MLTTIPYNVKLHDFVSNPEAPKLMLPADVYADAEWHNPEPVRGVKKISFITLQMSWDMGAALCVIVSSKHTNREKWEQISNNAREILRYLPNVKLLHLVYASPEQLPYIYGTEHREVGINFYSSINDIRPLFTRPEYHQLCMTKQFRDDLVKNGKLVQLVEGEINRQRRYSGKARAIRNTHWYVFKDWYGICPAGLEALLKAGNVTTAFKELSHTRDKSRMLDWWNDNPLEFLLYALGDVVVFEQAIKNYIHDLREIILGTFGLDPGWTSETVPKTVGALVNESFMVWLEEKFPGAVSELSALSTFDSPKAARRFRETVYNPCVLKVEGEFNGKKYPPKNPAVPFYRLLDPDAVHPASANGVLGNFLTAQNSTAMFNSIAYGGRAVNEHPTMPWLAHAFDLDISGCYGTGLSQFDYVIGYPSVIQSETGIDTGKTLGEVATMLWGADGKSGRAAGEGASQIVVNGTLSFDQDIIPSKPDIEAKTIRKSLTTLDPDNDREITEAAHIPGEFMFLKRELTNAVITRDLWQTILAVSSDRELSEWKSLRVVTAKYYDKRNVISDWGVFREIIRHYVHKPKYKTVKLGNRHHRQLVPPKECFIVPLREFINPLLAYRKDLKKQMKSASGEERAKLDARQNNTKLFINTFYGNTASPFFPMSNTVLANNITARARKTVWMLNKALGTRQSITDGGYYSPLAVRFIMNNQKRPSFHTMSDFVRLENHRGVRVAPLIDETDISKDRPMTFSEFYYRVAQAGKRVDSTDPADAEVSFAKTFAHLNAKVLEHCNKFWANYGLQLQFELEHKAANTRMVAVFSQKSNYCAFNLVRGDDGRWVVCDQTTTKIRGIRPNEMDTHQKPRELFAHMDTIAAILNDGRDGLKLLEAFYDAATSNPTVELEREVKLNSYRQSSAKMSDDAVLPGDTETRSATYHMRKTDGLILNDYAEHKRADEAEERQRRRFNSAVAKGEDARLGTEAAKMRVQRMAQTIPQLLKQLKQLLNIK